MLRGILIVCTKQMIYTNHRVANITVTLKHGFSPDKIEISTIRQLNKLFYYCWSEFFKRYISDIPVFLGFQWGRYIVWLSLARDDYYINYIYYQCLLIICWCWLHFNGEWSIWTKIDIRKMLYFNLLDIPRKTFDWDTKGISRSGKSKNERQHNDQAKKGEQLSTKHYTEN